MQRDRHIAKQHIRRLSQRSTLSMAVKVSLFMRLVYGFIMLRVATRLVHKSSAWTRVCIYGGVRAGCRSHQASSSPRAGANALEKRQNVRNHIAIKSMKRKVHKLHDQVWLKLLFWSRNPLDINNCVGVCLNTYHDMEGKTFSDEVFFSHPFSLCSSESKSIHHKWKHFRVFYVWKRCFSALTQKTQQDVLCSYFSISLQGSLHYCCLRHKATLTHPKGSDKNARFIKPIMKHSCLWCGSHKKHEANMTSIYGKICTSSMHRVLIDFASFCLNRIQLFNGLILCKMRNNQCTPLVILLVQSMPHMLKNNIWTKPRDEWSMSFSAAVSSFGFVSQRVAHSHVSPDTNTNDANTFGQRNYHLNWYCRWSCFKPHLQAILRQKFVTDFFHAVSLCIVSTPLVSFSSYRVSAPTSGNAALFWGIAEHAKPISGFFVRKHRLHESGMRFDWYFLCVFVCFRWFSRVSLMTDNSSHCRQATSKVTRHSGDSAPWSGDSFNASFCDTTCWFMLQSCNYQSFSAVSPQQNPSFEGSIDSRASFRQQTANSVLLSRFQVPPSPCLFACADINVE